MIGHRTSLAACLALLASVSALPVRAQAEFIVDAQMAIDLFSDSVSFALGDLDGDGIDEILTGRGPGPQCRARVRGWNFDGAAVAPLAGVDFIAYDPSVIRHGVKIAGKRSD